MMLSCEHVMVWNLTCALLPASMIGVSSKTAEVWKIGTGQPSAPALRLICEIDTNPA